MKMRKIVQDYPHHQGTSITIGERLMISHLEESMILSQSFTHVTEVLLL